MQVLWCLREYLGGTSVAPNKDTNITHNKQMESTASGQVNAVPIQPRAHARQRGGSSRSRRGRSYGDT